MGDLSQQAEKIRDDIGDNPYLRTQGSMLKPFSVVNSSTEIAEDSKELEAKERMRVTSGAQASGTFAGSQRFEGLHGSTSEKDKKDKQADSTTYFILSTTMQQRYDNAVQDIENRIDAAEQLRELIEKGELDRNNPAHVALYRRIYKDATDEDVDAFFNMPPEEQIDQMNDYVQEANQIIDDADRSLNQANTSEEGESIIRNMEEQHRNLIEVQNLQQETEASHNDILQSIDLYEDDLLDESSLSADEQIGVFVKGMARAEQIDDPAERLQAQKECVESLDEEQQLEMSTYPEYEQFFEEGYFDQKDQELSSDFSRPNPDMTSGFGLS